MLYRSNELTEIGGPVQVRRKADSPAVRKKDVARDDRIIEVIESKSLTDWERKFLLDCYGKERLTKKQRSMLKRLIG